VWEISLFEADEPEKAEAAMTRLEARKEKRRESHLNNDRINAKAAGNLRL
jgi:hypothetical protein